MTKPAKQKRAKMTLEMFAAPGIERTAQVSGQFEHKDFVICGPATGDDPEFDRFWKAAHRYCKHLIRRGEL